MKRPSAPTMLFGHPLVAIAAFALLAFAAYRWWIGATDAGAPVILLVIAVACGKANERAERYWQWQREWSAMSGQVSRRRVSAGGLRKVASAIAFVIFALMALAYLCDPNVGWAAGLVLIALVFGVGRMVWLRFITQRAQHRNSQAVAVAACLPIPAHSPTLEQAYAALPDHCRALIARR